MSRRGQMPLKPEEIEKMRAVCQLAANILVEVKKILRPGMTTLEIDTFVANYTRDFGATSAPLGYHGFPRSICTSVNDVVCHGVPDDKTILREGDIINVDVTPFKDGFYGDTSATFCIGQVSAGVLDLVQTAEMARDIGIKELRPGGTTGDVGFATQKFVIRKGYEAVREIGGHGIGRIFHDDPFVPSFGKKGKGEVLTPWTCLTVEPMINMGTHEIDEFDIPASTIKYYRTRDRQLSAQFEHTVLITDVGFEILTLPTIN